MLSSIIFMLLYFTCGVGIEDLDQFRLSCLCFSLRSRALVEAEGCTGATWVTCSGASLLPATRIRHQIWSNLHLHASAHAVRVSSMFAFIFLKRASLQRLYLLDAAGDDAPRLVEASLETYVRCFPGPELPDTNFTASPCCRWAFYRVELRMLLCFR